MQDGSTISMNSYMAAKALYFMVTWIIFKNHLLEVNRETMAFQTLTIVGLFLLIIREDSHQ